MNYFIFMLSVLWYSAYSLCEVSVDQDRLIKQKRLAWIME